jgi:beta-galactosidase GanA
MEMIDVTVWTVTQGDENSASLRDLNVSRDLATALFQAAVGEFDDMRVRLLPGDGAEASNRADWVRLEARSMTVALSDLVRVIAEASPASPAP